MLLDKCYFALGKDEFQHIIEQALRMHANLIWKYDKVHVGCLFTDHFAVTNTVSYFQWSIED